MTTVVQAHVYISGNVQGVYYRASTQEEAQRLGANGWVKNLDDGRVEAVFEGPESVVDTLLEWCHNGPSRASVSDVDVTFQEPEGIDEFHIKY